jgi:acetyltransferase-like isoleucine patch superfamily enzyme
MGEGTEPQDRMKPPFAIEHNVPTRWHWVVAYPDHLNLDWDTDIGAFTYIQAQYGVTIGKGVKIGSHCSIYSISTISRSGQPQIGRVIIEPGAQVGTHSTIMPGVLVPRDALIPAYSFIKRNSDVK